MATVDIASDMFDIGLATSYDNNIRSYEYREYESQNLTAIKIGQAIQIHIPNQDNFTQSSKSYHFEDSCSLASTTNSAYTATTLVTQIN